MKVDKNIRIIGGNIAFRRFAYLSKTDRSRFGLLEAVSMADAKKYLGSGFYVRITWLSAEEENNVHDRERRWEIVKSIFLSSLSQSFIGDKKMSELTDQSNELYVVEYSRNQRWFRVDQLERITTKNLQLLLNRIESDFVILYIGNQKQCFEACEQIQESFKNSDGRFPEEAHKKHDDSHEVKRLRGRVIELENQLEAMMGYTTT